MTSETVSYFHITCDFSADGRRIIIPEDAEGESTDPSIRIVQNWYEEFRDRE